METTICEDLKQTLYRMGWKFVDKREQFFIYKEHSTTSGDRVTVVIDAEGASVPCVYEEYLRYMEPDEYLNCRGNCDYIPIANKSGPELIEDYKAIGMTYDQFEEVKEALRILQKSVLQ